MFSVDISKAYDDWSLNYDDAQNPTRDADAIVTRAMLQGYSFALGLEWGCGTGKNTSFYSSICDSLTASDFSKGMLDKAKEKTYPGKVEFKEGDILAPWDFASASLDFVACNLILEHVPRLHPVFQETVRVLGRGGMFFISEYHPFRQYLGKSARFEKAGETIHVSAYVHHLSEYWQSVKENGFEIIDLQETFDADVEKKPPRLLSLLLRKK